MHPISVDFDSISQTTTTYFRSNVNVNNKRRLVPLSVDYLSLSLSLPFTGRGKKCYLFGIILPLPLSSNNIRRYSRRFAIKFFPMQGRRRKCVLLVATLCGSESDITVCLSVCPCSEIVRHETKVVITVTSK